MRRGLSNMILLSFKYESLRVSGNGHLNICFFKWGNGFKGGNGGSQPFDEDVKSCTSFWAWLENVGHCHFNISVQRRRVKKWCLCQFVKLLSLWHKPVGWEMVKSESWAREEPSLLKSKGYSYIHWHGPPHDAKRRVTSHTTLLSLRLSAKCLPVAGPL